MVDLVIPADIMAVIATLQAAQIQANYAIGAAVLSSLIGAAGIVFAANYAFKSGLKTQQHNNILEAKREVYLDVVASGQLFISSINRFPRVNSNFYETFTNYYDDFSSKLNKVLIVCDDQNKKDTVKVIGLLELIYNTLNVEIYNYQNTGIDLVKYTQEFNEKNEKLEDIEAKRHEARDRLDQVSFKRQIQQNQKGVADRIIEKREIEIEGLEYEIDILGNTYRIGSYLLEDLKRKMDSKSLAVSDIESRVESILTNHKEELSQEFSQLNKKLRIELF